MSDLICKKHHPPCPEDCIAYRKRGKALCRKIPMFTSKTKYTKVLVLNKFKRLLKDISNIDEILKQPKTMIYIQLRTNLTSEEIQILPKLLKLLVKDIQNNVYKSDELALVFEELNLKQYIRDDKNKQISDEDLEDFFHIFKLKGYAKYDNNSNIVNQLEVLKLLQILLLSEREFIEKYIEVESIEAATPLEIKKKSAPKPVMVPISKMFPQPKTVISQEEEKPVVVKTPLEKPSEERWLQARSEAKEGKQSKAVEMEPEIDEMSVQDLDERPQSPSLQDINESRTYIALKHLADEYSIDKDKFTKFTKLTRVKYYIRLRDRIKTTDLKIAKAQYNNIKEDIESYDYTNSNVKSLDRTKQFIINKVVSNLPLCKFILNNNGQQANTGDLNRYAEFLGVGSIDASPKEIKCFLVLREIVRDELEILTEYFPQINYR